MMSHELVGSSSPSHRWGLAFLALMLATVLHPTLADQLPTGQVAAEQQQDPLRVLILGDSFSSGTGARDESGNPNYELANCGRSPSTFGALYAQLVSPAAVVTNRACGNAGIKNFYEEQTPLCSTMTLPPQLDAMEEVNPHIILLSAGGNDAGFPLVAITCLALQDPCACKWRLKESRSKLPDLYVSLRDLLREMYHRANTGQTQKIVVVGYPHQLLADPTRRPSVFCRPYDIPTEMRAFESEQRDILRLAVHIVNKELETDLFQFVDTMDFFETHEIRLERLYITNLNPDAWIWNIFETCNPAEGIHLNPTGHMEIANYLQTQIDLDW